MKAISFGNQITVIKSTDYKTTRWDGGLTRQICLFPEEASYQERNFLVRISSAVIEKEESDFTYLPGIHRFLMMQKETARLVFENGREEILEPFRVLEFEGSEKIRCFGTGTDLNLMLRGSACGSMCCKDCHDKDALLLPSDDFHRAVYVLQGSALARADAALVVTEGKSDIFEQKEDFRVHAAGKGVAAEEGDTLLIPAGTGAVIRSDSSSLLRLAIIPFRLGEG